ncbi:MAG TPA: protein kinase, partial [Ktedonobacteraceae bacterium]
MIYTFNQYYLTAHLARKAARDIYLAYAAHEPEHKVLLKIYDAQCRYPESTPEDFHARASKFKRLSHPHMVPILDIGIEEGKPYVVSDYFPGGSLRQQLERMAPEHMLLDTALALVLEVGSALSEAHSQQLVHQRVKPENVFFNAQGQALLADFSLHEIIKEPMQESQPDDRVISYMASEQLAGRATAASDQYALACLLYELITGKLPFTTRDLSYLWQRYTIPSPTPPSQYVATVPKQLESAILKALSKKPEDRYGDVATFLAALKEVMRPEPPTFPFKHIIPRTDHQAAVQIPRRTQPSASVQAAARKEPESAASEVKEEEAELWQWPQGEKEMELSQLSFEEKEAERISQEEEVELSQLSLGEEEIELARLPLRKGEKAERSSWSDSEEEVDLSQLPLAEEKIERAQFSFSKEKAVQPIPLDKEEKIEPSQGSSKEKKAEPASRVVKGEKVEPASRVGKGEKGEQAPFFNKEEKAERSQLIGKGEEGERSQLIGKEEVDEPSSFSFMKSFSQRMDGVQKAASVNRVVPGQEGWQWEYS